MTLCLVFNELLCVYIFVICIYMLNPGSLENFPREKASTLCWAQRFLKTLQQKAEQTEFTGGRENFIEVEKEIKQCSVPGI